MPTLLGLAADPCGTLITSFEKPIVLKTDWLFRKGDNLDWRDETVEESFWVKRSVPDYGISKTENLTGYHWYRCSFFLPENYTTPVEPIAIQLGRIRDIDEFYLNGTLIDKTGTVLPKMEVDFQKIRIYSLPTHLLKPGLNIMAIRIYAATNLNGLKEAPTIAKERLLRENVFSKEAFAMVCGYVFIFMGIYFLVGSIVRGRAGENFFFALFSIFMGIYVLIRTQHRDILFESFTWSYVAELLVLICLPVFFINFMHQYLKMKRSLVLLVYEVFLFALFVITLFFRTPKTWILVIALFNYTLPVAMGLVIYLFVKNGKENIAKVKYILIGIACLLPTILIDSLSALEIISMPGTLYLGFLIFLVMISIQLSNDIVLGLENFIEQEKELIQMERVKTGFLINLSSEFKSGMEKIKKAIDNISSNQTKVSIKEQTKTNQKQAAKKKTKPKVNNTKQELDPIKQAEDHISYMGYMVEEAILLRKLEDKTYIPFYENFSVSELIKHCVSNIENHLEQYRRSTTIDVKPNDLEIYFPKELLFCILRNLIENAYQYTDPKTDISIEFFNRDGYHQLVVMDEGMGLSQLEMETIFQKFVRGYRDKKNEIPGAGIGLTLVEATAKFLGGTVSLKSSEGMGAKFTIRIPEKIKK
ncbi:ATP-binding protein [Leptospira sp. 2 VSF19]|uniref:histidine kinase n=2 Tax=Leptospira soteropolitanensis TaxID=2950025 RepID=A0AAW5V9Z2_9LEPT|nr:ATP-binding protein [Leptospira soteropolitanensis]MCW7498642.1 ATP-binding protein [Leptospira soteropolitanensis]MCW7521765.1 ATP-binding protein [Leptospira soteropolitanensis]MCW7524746.1 ATP-binding protein [Leptospira soteropolitanensis]MCW7528613.1 ATP-binding protein [Leptospira soteropolitanensis]